MDFDKILSAASSAAPIAAGALLDSGTTDTGQKYAAWAATPLNLLDEQFGTNMMEAAVEGARTAELTGDGKDALLKAFDGWKEGKTLGDVAGNFANDGLGVAADYGATKASQSFLDYLDQEVLGGLIPESVKALAADWVGEKVQEVVTDFGKDLLGPETPVTPAPGHPIPEEALREAREVAPEGSGGQEVDGSEVRAGAGGDFQRAPDKDQGLSA